MKVSIESQLASSFLREQNNTTPYKDGSGDRYSSRRQVRQNLASPDWVKQDVNMLFKTGNYLFSIPVKGKTNDYVVTIEIPDFLTTLDKFIQTGKFDVHTFTEALTNAMNTQKINVACSCEDFLYRHSYVQTVAGNNAGRPENRPALMTNPQNRKGVCKHIIYALSERAWITKVAINLYQYVMNIYKTKRDLFDLIVRPALHDITDEQITGQPDLAKSALPGATECLNNYYTGRQIYDDDQNFILAVAQETGSDISPYVTPENSPEQISEISVLYSMNCPMKLLQALSNKDIDLRTLQLFNNILSKETERDINKLLSIANDNANKIYPKYIRYAILKDLKEINNFLEL